MSALSAASELRTQHEIEAHGYLHKRLEEHPRGPLGSVRIVAKPASS